MRRADLLSQMTAVEAELARMAQAQHFSYEICVLNYDYSKRFALAISPEGELDIRAIAARVHAIVDGRYAQLKPDRAAALRNITVCSGEIGSYEAYQRAFTELRRLYRLSFFLRECDLLTAQQARQQQTPYSMIEAEREMAAISDALFLRDVERVRALLGTLLVGHLKRAQDRQLLAEVLVFLKKRISDLCLILGIPWTEEISACLDMERFLCIEELHDSICGLLERLLRGTEIPPLKPDGLAIRAARYIGGHYYLPLDLTTIAEHLHVNATYLSHAFKSEMRVSITQYITRIRIEQAQRLLNESDLRVAQIAQNVGLADPRYFNTVFKRHVGCTPTEYRERADMAAERSDKKSHRTSGGFCLCVLHAHPFLAEAGENHLLGLGGLLLGQRLHALQGVRNAQLFVLVYAHGVIGQHVQRLHVFQMRDEPAELLLLPGVVGDAGDDHMADPERDVFALQILREREDALIAVAGQFPVRVGIDVLNVQHDQVGHVHQRVELLIVRAFPLAVGDAGGVDAGVNVLFLGQAEELQHEVDLQERLAAGDGDAAVFVELAVALKLADDLLRGHPVSLADLPGIRIVAVLAAHGAALREHHKAQARAVHRAEALD